MNDQAQFIWDRQTEAYFRAPFGSWRQRLLPGVCKHQQVRCTHGDEILARRMRRRVCMVCGRSLPGALPVVCFFTGQPHPGLKHRGHL